MIKQVVRTLVLSALLFSYFVILGNPQPAQALNLSLTQPVLAEMDMRNPADAKLGGEYGQKVDVNNANVRLFRKYRGFYPTLAKKIVDNAPYENVEDILEIPNLSDRQVELLQANLDNFTVTPPADVFNEGGDRYNPGYY